MTCAARNPQDETRTCILSSVGHADHADRQGIWPNTEVQREMHLLATHKPKTDQDVRKHLIQIAGDVARERRKLVESVESGREARNQGMSQALMAAEDWTARAKEVLEALAGSEFEFTADDVIDVVGLPHQSQSNVNNSVGALFAAASRAGLIERVGDRESRRTVGHARRIAVWRGTREST